MRLLFQCQLNVHFRTDPEDCFVHKNMAFASEYDIIIAAR